MRASLPTLLLLAACASDDAAPPAAASQEVIDAAEARGVTAGDPGGPDAPQKGLASSPLGFIPSGQAGPAVIAVTLTDAPGDFEAVPVTIASVSAHMVDASGSDTGAADTGLEPDEGDGGWISLADTPTEWDLLQLQDGVTGLMGRSEVPAAAYDQIRLVISAAAVVVDGETHELSIPSGAQTGLKLSYDFDVTRGGEYELRLDFDAAESIRETGHGYQLTPQVSVDYFGPVESESASGEVGESDGAGDTGSADTGG